MKLPLFCMVNMLAGKESYSCLTFVNPSTLYQLKDLSRDNSSQEMANFCYVIEVYPDFLVHKRVGDQSLFILLFHVTTVSSLSPGG